jgi:protein PET100
MGTWKMEIAKMALYVSFPVGVFIVFNEPAFYEATILAARREIQSRTDHDGQKKLKEVIRQRKLEQLDQKITQRASE